MPIRMRAVSNGVPRRVTTTITCDGGGLICDTIQSDDYQTAFDIMRELGWIQRQDDARGRRFLCPSCQKARVE